MIVNALKVRDMAAKVVFPYSEANAGMHREFAARMWPHDLRRRDERYNRWKFRAPEGPEIPGLLLAIQNKKVVGQIGLTPAVLRLNGQNLPIQWACDYMVDPAYRIRGIGPLLLGSAVCKDMVTLADNPTPEAASVIKSFGFREITGPVRMLLPLNPEHIMSWKLPGRFRRFTALAVAAARPYFAWRTRRLRANGRCAPGIGHCTWQRLAETVSNWQHRLAMPYVIHDRSFLEWRSAKVNGFAEPVGALHSVTGGYLLYGKGGRYLYVFDWAAESFEECRALFAELSFAGGQISADTISVLANSDQERRWLSALGLLTVPTPVKIYSYCPGGSSPVRLNSFYFSHCDAHANL